MLSTNKVLAVLAGLLLSSRSLPWTFGHSGAVTPTQEAAPQTKDKELVHATTSYADGRDDERTGDERVSLEELMRFEDIADEVKADVMKFLPRFKFYNENDKEAFDVHQDEKAQKNEQAKSSCLWQLYEVYLGNCRAFEAYGSK